MLFAFRALSPRYRIPGRQKRSGRKDNSLRTSRRRFQATLGHPDERTLSRERFLIRFRCRVPELQPDSLSPDGCLN